MASSSRSPVLDVLTQGVSLTPIRKRRSRISHSPIKNTPPPPIPLWGFPQSQSWTFPESRPKEVGAQYHLSTSALEFEEFSFRGDDGSLCLSNITKDQENALHNYLVEHYGARDLFYQEPFLLIGCQADLLPLEEERPFTVAGLVAVWRDLEEPTFSWLVDSFGGGPEIEVDPEVMAEICPPAYIPNEVILYLADHIFPDCEAITTLWSAVIVELPLMSREAHQARLKVLPEGFEDQCVILRYYNGPLPNSQRRSERVVSLKPKFIDDACDQTDYVALDKTFYPGTMLSSVDIQGEPFSSVTAGILVEKEGQRRLTCSFHNWEQHYDKYTDKFGQTDEESQRIFKVVQGTNPGTDIGFIRERIGDTDIAFAHLHDAVAFDNNFMETDSASKSFILGRDQVAGDQYVIDSFATGKQRLFGMGRRCAVGRRGREPWHDVRVPESLKHPAPSPQSVLHLDGAKCMHD